MEVLAVIPARGGSKGIPRKNLQHVGGVPLVERSCRTAKMAKTVSRVIVSTDDAEIGRVAAGAGTEVVWRPEEISGDTATSEEALLHVLGEIKKQGRRPPDLLVLLQCTSPFTAPEDIDGVVRLLGDGGYDTAFTGARTHAFLWRRRGGDCEAVNHDKWRRPMRQQREAEFAETGAAYAMWVDGFLKHRHRFFGKTGIYEVPRIRALEIDEPEDLELANLLVEVIERRGAGRAPSDVRAVVFDFDGVFTDNRVIVAEDGREAVVCSRSDGLGIERVRKSGVMVAVISKERNAVVEARCRKLGIECIQGVEDKLPVMLEWLRAKNIEPERAAYLGNDVNDVACMKAVGWGVCVADAHEEAKAAAQHILRRPGGHGAVRELCDLIVEAREHG